MGLDIVDALDDSIKTMIIEKEIKNNPKVTFLDLLPNQPETEKKSVHPRKLVKEIRKNERAIYVSPSEPA